MGRCRSGSDRRRRAGRQSVDLQAVARRLRDRSDGPRRRADRARQRSWQPRRTRAADARQRRGDHGNLARRDKVCARSSGGSRNRKPVCRAKCLTITLRLSQPRLNPESRCSRCFSRNFTAAASSFSAEILELGLHSGRITARVALFFAVSRCSLCAGGELRDARYCSQIFINRRQLQIGLPVIKRPRHDL